LPHKTIVHRKRSHNCHTKQSFVEREATIATQNNGS
jgi:hypothetical protein